MRPATATSLLLGGDDGDPILPPPPPSTRVEDCKRELIRRCVDRRGSGGGRSTTVEDSIRELERLGKDLGFGQAL